MAGRITTTAGELARRGFAQPEASAELVAALSHRRGDICDWLGVVARAADPDRALAWLHRVEQIASATMDEVWADIAWFSRVVMVVGASQAIAQHLVRWPIDVNVLREDFGQLRRQEILARLLVSMGREDLIGIPPYELANIAISERGAADGLRVGNYREIMRIAARDLVADNPIDVVDSIAAELADLADAVITCALMLARGEIDQHEQVRLAIVALGKCGARELNYLSDVDVLYVGEPASNKIEDEKAMEIGGRIAGAIARICSTRTAAGSIWQVDAALRPEGNAGPLVRSLASHRVYYERWASAWEFQAMMKARLMAGDRELGEAFCEMITPLVWQVGDADNFVTDTQAMRQRVISLIPAKEADREIKLAKGGLRDVEFTVQLLQLVHGRVDDRIRCSGTFDGLAALVKRGYIGRVDGAQLERSYRILRVMEHRVQLIRLRRTHLIPSDEEERRQVGRAMRLDQEVKLWELWRETRSKVQELHKKAFYSPLLEAVSRLKSDELTLSAEAAHIRLRALGFNDPKAAFEHIASLTRGVTRSAEIQRQLMPAMLGWLAAGPNPDLGLLAFRQLSESLGSTPWYLRALRDEGHSAERLARILATSRYVVNLLHHDPASVELLVTTNDVVPRSHDDLVTSMRSITARHDNVESGVNAVRALRRRELFRLAVGDGLKAITLSDLGKGLSDLASATIEAALILAASKSPDAPPVGVVAMGRWGGRELSYGSDADVMFVVADEYESDLPLAVKLVTRMRELLKHSGAEPPLNVDAGLRPEGRNGPMVRTLSSYLAYYERWASTWEAQALLRATYGAGDAQVVGALLEGIQKVRWPTDGLTETQLLEIRKLKARMQRERIAKGVEPRRHLKMGPGGLTDVEWTVQLLQLQHAGEIPELRVTNTMQALTAAEHNGLLSEDEAHKLAAAWQFATRIRNATMIVRGRAQDTLPADARDIAAAATLLGYGKGEASRLVDDWGRTARHAARVVETIFWGKE